MKVKMSLSPLVWYFLLFILLDVAVKSQMSSNSNSNAFLQGSNDVRYIVDSIPIPVHKDFSGNSGTKVQNVDESTNFNSKAHLKFEPPLLDFKERHLGVSHHEKVTIINLNENKTVHMSSISGNTVHFHSSFFENKIIPPLGNTSFNVVFLGREEGDVESNLFIHTSEGSFKYQVRGSSIQSPYRLRPLSGVRLPLNASFSPLIQMHNPYSTPLQLVEVYSSGGEFHLELPSGELEGPRHLWEIPAFLTKPIIRVRFHARAQKNHTAYIRLKVNNSEEVLVVPLEVEVGSACGLYSPDDVIDFGIGGSNDPTTTVKLWLHNSWKKPIKIQNVISTPVSKALRIDFEPVKVPPESDEPTEVASLTFDWSAALETGLTSGRIVVKSKQSGQKLVIPYTATVLAGGLGFDTQLTRFRSDESDNPPRTFHLTNNFRIPIAITNVTLSKEARPYFELRQFQPLILEAGQQATLFEIVPAILPHLTLDSNIVIYTNVSTLSVPLLCYNGRLIKVISRRNESELELGTVGSGTEKQVLFALVNENPVPVTLLSWDTDLPSTTITVASIQSGNASRFLSQYSLYNETTQERSVGPGQYAVVRVVVRVGTHVGDMRAQITLRTEYEIVQIAAHMRVEHGSLRVSPDPIVFDNCFPGKLCTEALRVQSLFSVAMAVTGVSAVPTDPRLSYSPAAPPLLPPTATTDIGTLSFDTELLATDDNYLSTTHNLTGGTRWQDTLELPSHCPDYDLSLLAARYEHYRNLSSRLLNLSLQLDTTEVKEHLFGAQLRLSWPSLSRDVMFPLTQVGNTTRRTVVINNPGTQHPLLIQLVMENSYPSVQTLLDDLPTKLKPESVSGTPMVPGQFVVHASDSPYRLNELPTHRDTWLFLLPPATNTSVRVTFTPSAALLSSALLLLRNNLTVVETVQLSGTGAFAQFKFGNRKPGSSAPLLFELAEKHLKDCDREKQRKLPTPNLTVKRSFTARNTGALPILVHGFHISGLTCEGYGFRVLNCEPFQLAPNTTRKVDIAFTPDFTLARVQRTLGVWTSESETAANYTLVATLPPFLLSSCSGVLARPAWEPLLYYCAVTFMVFLLVCVLAAAFLESDRALKCALLAMSRDNATIQPVLDLKSIGTGVGLSVNNTPSSSTTASDKSDSSAISWTKAPLPSPPPHEPEVVKEKLLKAAEAETVAQVFNGSTSKSARKKDKEKTVVSKRYSDPTDSSSNERRSSWANVFTTKQVANTLAKPHPKPSVSVTPTHVEVGKQTTTENKRKPSKKTTSNNRSVRELPNLPVINNHEDTETSSTTTESSHDDGDKEVEVTMALRDEAPGHKGPRVGGGGGTRAGKGSCGDVTKKSPPAERTGGSASSLDFEWEDEEPTERETFVKKPHNPTRNRKSSNKGSKLSENSVSNQSNGRSKASNSANKQSGMRGKEKQTPSQKRSMEKTPLLPKPAPIVYEPPPPPMGLWDESRASFSDVVARSDSTKHSLEQPVPSLHSHLGTTSQSVLAPQTLLGPIGPKKTFPSVWDCWNDSSELASSPLPVPLSPAAPPPTSSFFMDTFTDTRPAPAPAPAPAPTPAPVIPNTYEGGWTEPNLILKMLQAGDQRRLGVADEFQRRPVYQGTWTPWEPICTGTNPVTEPTTTPAVTNPPSLWGNDVWAPPPPPDTWAPPGLSPRSPPRLDDTGNADLDIGLDYDPFRSLSNIWAPHNPNNFWKPPTTNNN